MTQNTVITVQTVQPIQKPESPISFTFPFFLPKGKKKSSRKQTPNTTQLTMPKHRNKKKTRITELSAKLNKTSGRVLAARVFIFGGYR